MRKIKKKKDSIFTFSKWRRAFYNSNEKYAKTFFKDSLVKKGYLLKDIKERKIIEISVVMAWARKKGINYQKRWEMQRQIDKMKEPTEIKPLKSAK